MEFYHSCFGGDLTIAQVKDTAMKGVMPPSMHEKVINARLKTDEILISASDWLRPYQTPKQGNMVCLYLESNSKTELKNIFTKLSDGANVTDPLKEEFHGMYGALNDKFGIRWMFHSNNS